MIDVAQAILWIQRTARPLGTESVSIANAVGRTLAEDLIADLDSPPFAKSMMDGYAVRGADFAAGQKNFPIVHCLVAGETEPAEINPGTVSRIMTGAAIPQGADAVVMLEETTSEMGSKAVSILSKSVRVGQNILGLGSIYRRGEQVLPIGHQISAPNIGWLAEAVSRPISVRKIPVVGVIATGSEFCLPDQSPRAGQIRNSNGPLLLAMAAAQNTQPVDLGIAHDDKKELEQSIRRGLAADVLVLTGGVSAGMLDLVPGVLQSLGVRQIFHKVSLKPGKPVWFGVHESAQHRCLVFGLPGNPVSAFVCFHLFVNEALAVLRGQTNALVEPTTDQLLTPTGPPLLVTRHIGSPTRALLGIEHVIRGDRPTYWPSQVSIAEGKAMVMPLDWKGSADQRCLGSANCLAVFPNGDQTYPAGALIEIREFR